jgi:uncharacterized protein YbaP (TraB family)
MIRALLASFAVIGFAMMAAAQDGNKSADPADQRPEPQKPTPAAARPWVWQVDTPHATIWLSGCLHLGTSRQAAILPAYLPFYQRSGVVYFETLPSDWETYEVKQHLRARGCLPKRRTLASRIPDVAWQAIKQNLAASPAKLTEISAMEPWLAGLTLTEDGYTKAGLRREDALEGFIQRLAAQDRKPCGSLESPRDQINALADASLADQRQFLTESLTPLAQITASTAALETAWIAGNDDALKTALGLDAAPSAAGLHRNLIGDRNHRWVRKIREIAARGRDVMLVVGVEHLVSEPQSLPAFLEREGFTVRRTSVPLERSTLAPVASRLLQPSKSGTH